MAMTFPTTASLSLRLPIYGGQGYELSYNQMDVNWIDLRNTDGAIIDVITSSAFINQTNTFQFPQTFSSGLLGNLTGTASYAIEWNGAVGFLSTASYKIDSASFSGSIANLQNWSTSLDLNYATDAQLNYSSSALSAGITSSVSASTAAYSSSFGATMASNILTLTGATGSYATKAEVAATQSAILTGVTASVSGAIDLSITNLNNSSSALIAYTNTSVSGAITLGRTELNSSSSALVAYTNTAVSGAIVLSKAELNASSSALSAGITASVSGAINLSRAELNSSSSTLQANIVTSTSGAIDLSRSELNTSSSALIQYTNTAVSGSYNLAIAALNSSSSALSAGVTSSVSASVAAYSSSNGVNMSTDIANLYTGSSTFHAYSASMNLWTGSGTSQFGGTASFAKNVALVGDGITVNGMQLTASVRTVNGVTPVDGNIAVSITQTLTGTSASLAAYTASSNPDGLIWIVSGDPTPANNGDSYIWVSSSQDWSQLSSFDTAAGDARYLMLAGGNSMAANLNVGGYRVTSIADAQASNDAASLGQLTSSLLSYLTTSSFNTYTSSLGSTFAGTAATASYVAQAQTASYVNLAQTASYFITSSVSTASYIDVTGSGVLVNWDGSQLQLSASTAFLGLNDVTTVDNVSYNPIQIANSTGLQVFGKFVNGENGTIRAYGDFSHAEGVNTTAGRISSSIMSILDVLSLSDSNGFYASTTFSSVSGAVAYGDVVTDTGITIPYTLVNTVRLDGPYPSTASIDPSPEIVITSATFDGTNTTLEFDPPFPSSYTVYTAIGNYSHAEGFTTTTVGQNSHAEGSLTTAIGVGSHAEGGYRYNSLIYTGSVAIGDYSHAEGSGTTSVGEGSHTEGFLPVAIGDFSHAEGSRTTTVGLYSHAEGATTTAIANSSHAEGQQTTTTGTFSHAEGNLTTAIGIGAHSEGQTTIALGNYSHAEGGATIARGNYSHAEGYNTTAKGIGSHAEGSGSIAAGTAQTVVGRWNIEDSNAHFIVGDGTGASTRANLIAAYTDKLTITGSIIVNNTASGIGGNNLLHLIPGTNVTITSGSTGYTINATAGGGGGSGATGMTLSGNNLLLQSASATLSTVQIYPASSSVSSSFSATASYVVTALTASYFLTSSVSTASYVQVAQTASYVATASYVNVTGSGVLVNWNGSQMQLTASVASGTPSLQAVTTVGNSTTSSIAIGGTADASAILTLASTTQGVLFPRMTNSQRTSISSPATGLIVYCTDSPEGLFINKSTGWVQII